MIVVPLSTGVGELDVACRMHLDTYSYSYGRAMQSPQREAFDFQSPVPSRGSRWEATAKPR